MILPLNLEEKLEVIWRKKMVNVENRLHKRSGGEGEGDHWVDSRPILYLSSTETVTLSSMWFVVNIQMGRRVWYQLHSLHANWVSYGLTGAAYLVDSLVIIAIVAIIQTYAATNPHVLSVECRIRIVRSTIFFILAFSPIPVVLVVLVLL
ncbi:hypothetical protein FRC15_008864 [Serendipita sp. 397]|nr:hypothetical protein FRC15_008864 [Serendipita sp. 397]